MNEYSFRRVRIERRSDVADFLKAPLNDGLPREKFARLAERFPQYVKYGDSIQLERPLGDPNLEELLSYAKELGAIIQKDKGDTPSQVYIYDFPSYSREEQLSSQFVECALVEPVFSEISSTSTEDSLGLCYENAAMKSEADTQEFGSFTNLPHVIAVRGKAVELLRTAQLKHLRLVPLPTNETGGLWPASKEPLFIIWSDYELPPLDMELFDNDGNRYPRGRPSADMPKRVYAIDGYAINSRLHWESLKVGEFDIGRTRERLGGVQPFYHSLVYSQKARAVLEEIGMKLDIQPVVLRSAGGAAAGPGA